MKTQNNTREKVDDQVRRIILQGSAFLLSLVLLSQTANALKFQEQFSDNNTTRKMTLLKVDETSKTETPASAKGSTELKIPFEAFICEPEPESELMEEAWMTDESYFKANNLFIREETEKSLKVENWMLNNDYFVHPSVSESVEMEKTLEIEVWMTNDHFWGF